MKQQSPSRVPRRPEFVTLIAVYQFVTAGILLLMSCLILAVLFPAIFFYVDAAEGVFTGILMSVILIALLLGFAFASAVVGWGLLGMRDWARMGALVLAAFALIGFPIWTIVAILILVYLTSDDARYAFRPQDAPPQITKTTLSATSPEMAPMAAYKTEPPGSPVSPTEETRQVYYREGTTPATRTTNGWPADSVPTDETRAIPMPPPADPAEATETLYDEEADVSDHYRRWKASLQQEASTSDAGQPVEASEEAGTPAETEETAQSDLDAPLTAEEGEMTRRIWGPGEGTPEDPDSERTAEIPVEDPESQRTTEIPVEEPATEQTTEIPRADDDDREADEDEEKPERG